MGGGGVILKPQARHGKRRAVLTEDKMKRKIIPWAAYRNTKAFKNRIVLYNEGNEKKKMGKENLVSY